MTEKHTPVLNKSIELITRSFSIKGKKQKTRDNLATFFSLVPEVGIEPTLLAEHEFESCASTNSAIRVNGERKSTSWTAISPR